MNDSLLTALFVTIVALLFWLIARLYAHRKTVRSNTLVNHIVERDSQEWHYMWHILKNESVNKTLGEPTVAEYFDEKWQYMGTF